MAGKAGEATALDIQLVFDAWRTRRPRPDLCRLTADRAKLVRNRLGLGYTAADFVALVRFVFEADDSWAQFMRSNPRYTGLDYLLRVEKLADRVERALLWLEEHEAAERLQREQEATGVDLGPMAAFRSQGAGEA